jgi:hypothetical protein
VSFGPLAPGSPIDGSLTRLCTVRPMTTTRETGTGVWKPTVGTAVANIPCSLQPMSTSRSMLYKAEGQQSLFDLYLPLRRGNGTAIPVPVGTEFEIESEFYRSVGEGLRQGESGIQMVPVERRNR